MWCNVEDLIKKWQDEDAKNAQNDEQIDMSCYSVSTIYNIKTKMTDKSVIERLPFPDMIVEKILYFIDKADHSDQYNMVMIDLKSLKLRETGITSMLKERHNTMLYTSFIPNENINPKTLKRLYVFNGSYFKGFDSDYISRTAFCATCGEIKSRLPKDKLPTCNFRLY